LLFVGFKPKFIALILLDHNLTSLICHLFISLTSLGEYYVSILILLGIEPNKIKCYPSPTLEDGKFRIERLNVIGDWVYYLTTDKTTYKIKTDGTSNTAMYALV